MAHCPPAPDVVGFAVAACPFLHQLAERHGEQYARQIACRPCEPAAGPGARRPLLEELDDLQHTFTLFHGAEGVVPLLSPAATNHQGARCPFQQAAAAAKQIPDGAVAAPPPRSPGAGAPAVASLSLSFGGANNFGDFLFRHLREHMKQQRRSGPMQQRPADARAGSGPSSGAPQPPAGGNKQQPPSASRGPKPPGAAAAADAGLTSRPTGPGALGGSGAAAAGGPAAAAAAGSCPLRKWLGPYAGLLFNPQAGLRCPPPVVAARAALARTAYVRALRPQALEVKLMAIGATAALLNVPCGAWREHTAKFSLEWFVAVHATIPLVAMLRKAVVMPKLAILFTIGAAVAGQLVGSRLERARMQQQQQQQQRPVVAAAAAAAAPAKPRARTPRRAAAGEAHANNDVDLAGGVDGGMAVAVSDLAALLAVRLAGEPSCAAAPPLASGLGALMGGSLPMVCC